MLLHFEGGAKGLLYCSQIAAGEENGLRIRVYGETGGLEWFQMEPNTLRVTRHEQPATLLRTGVGELAPMPQAATRLPAGHPEGFIEAFANVYRGVAQAIRTYHGETFEADALLDFPDVRDGLAGMQFIDAVVESSATGNRWVNL